jgi:hypothetical protein
MDGVLFKKTFSALTDSTYPDNNSNAELFCNNEFVELESLSPLVKLNPGESTEHVETWEVFDDLNPLPEEIQSLLTD